MWSENWWHIICEYIEKQITKNKIEKFVSERKFKHLHSSDNEVKQTDTSHRRRINLRTKSNTVQETMMPPGAHDELEAIIARNNSYHLNMSNHSMDQHQMHGGSNSQPGLSKAELRKVRSTFPNLIVELYQRSHSVVLSNFKFKVMFWFYRTNSHSIFIVCFNYCDACTFFNFFASSHAVHTFSFYDRISYSIEWSFMHEAGIYLSTQL